MAVYFFGIAVAILGFLLILVMVQCRTRLRGYLMGFIKEAKTKSTNGKINGIHVSYLEMTIKF